MVLQKQPLRPCTVLHNFMHALAKFWILVRQKLCSYSVVARLPRCSAIVRPIRSGCRNGDHHAFWIGCVRNNCMQAQSTATGLPFFAMRMIKQPFYRRPCLARVLRFKQRRRLDTAIERVWIVSTAGG